VEQEERTEVYHFRALAVVAVVVLLELVGQQILAVAVGRTYYLPQQAGLAAPALLFFAIPILIQFQTPAVV
jgi:hypothetical protein